MKVLLVNGGPHENWCTYTALKEVEKELNNEWIQTEIFWLWKKPIADCLACWWCYLHKKCVINDVVNEFADKARQADWFIFWTPVHYAAASWALTTFMDRLFYSTFSDSDVFRLKPAACVISARRAWTTATFDQINKYFAMNQMPIISSRYRNMVHWTIPEEVQKDEEWMQIMRILWKNMAYYLKLVEAWNEKWIQKPEMEEIKFTNFIRD